MKKLFLLVCCAFLSLSLYAQKLSLAKIVQESVESMNGMSPVVYTPKILIADEANGYVLQHVVGLYEDKGNQISERHEYYATHGLWKTNGKNLIGSFYVFLPTEGEPYTYRDGYIPLNFSFYKDDAPTEVYDEKAVKEAYEVALEKLQAKGGEGTELLYADIPRKGTTIGLYIILGSEIKATKDIGILKWKQAFGELTFDKTTGKFTFVKK